jgi:DNA-binding transcriptional regulator GbsR (MarR family)
MSAAVEPSALERAIKYLAELGPRWGLPAEACRVHGYLYLVARPVAETELCETLEISATALAPALAWLADFRLIERVRRDAWRTGTDPWDLMMRALQERQRREVGPALDLLRDCRRAALAEGRPSRTVAGQIGKLLRLVEDIAAINRQAERLPPAAVRQMVGLGGMAARLLDRAFLGRFPGGSERS